MNVRSHVPRAGVCPDSVRFARFTALLALLAMGAAGAALQDPAVSNASTLEDTQTTSGLEITRQSGDTETAYFKVTDISNGQLFQNDGTTPIAENDFISVADGAAGLKFTPTANYFGTGSFRVQSSTTNENSGLGGSKVNASIDVAAVADTPSVTNASTLEDTQTVSGLVISRNAADGAEVTHFKITGIANGALYKNDGTTSVSDGDFLPYADAHAGLKFTPDANSFAAGGFTVQAATTDGDTGLGGSTVTATITVTAVADTPSVTNASTLEDTQTTSGLVISRNAADGAEVTHFKITSLANGSLFKNDGTTAVASGSFITFAEGNAGLKFTPSENSILEGSFVVQAATSGDDSGLGGSTVTATIAITPVADTPSVTNAATTEDTQTTSGLVISRNAADSSEVTHFKITSIANGTLYQNDGTAEIADGAYITHAQGHAGLKFTPVANSSLTGSFVVQASVSSDDTGLGGATATASISVTPVADTPSVTDASTTEDTQTTSGLVVTPNPADGPEVTHFKITAISGGALFQNDGTTAIAGNQFITAAESGAGLKFTPSANSYAQGHFSVQAATAANNGSLGGEVVTADITVDPVADTPSVTNASTDEDHQTTSGLVISRHPADGAEVTHFKISSLPSAAGVLYRNNGTTPIGEGEFIAADEGALGLKFTPRTDVYVSSATFVVQASLSNNDAGLGGAVVNPGITIAPIADTLSITNANTQEDTFNTAGLVVSRHPSDGAEVAYIHVTSILNGTLYRNNQTTQINNGDYIPFAEGELGLKFLPALNSAATGSFYVQASLTDAVNGSGLGGSLVLARVFVTTSADTPSVTPATTNEDTQTSSGLVIQRAASDGDEVTHFKITGIANGSLFQNDGTTPIVEGEFITYAQGVAGLKFTPALDTNLEGSFFVQASVSNDDGGLGGSQVQAIITVNPVPDTPNVTNAVTDEDRFNASGLVITRNAVDGPEITHFKITAISGGTLFQNDGLTPIDEGGFITEAQGAAGLKFNPTPNSVEDGSFDVQASLSNSGAGLGGAPATAVIDINPVNDRPVLDNAGAYKLTAINEDTTDAPGDAVSAMVTSDPAFPNSITDVDLTDPEGIAVTLVDNTHGAWEFSLDNGVLWQPFPVDGGGLSSLTPTSALLLRAEDRIRFVPAANYNGLIKPALAFTAWDQSAGNPGDIDANTTVVDPVSAFSVDTATAEMTVRPVNDAPDAVLDEVSTLENTPVVIDVLANDTDVENPTGLVVPTTAFITIISGASHGATGITLDGKITYSPDTAFYGMDTFVYRLTDRGEGASNPPFTNALSDTAAVNVMVNAVNDPPNAADDTVTTESGVEVFIDVLANDSDVEDGANLNPDITIIQGPDPAAAISIDPITGVIAYTPGPDYAGIDEIVYQVCDWGLEQDDPLPDLPPACSQAFVRIAVSQLNITVSTLDDNDDGLLDPGEMSLREAVSLIAAGGDIDFDPALFTPGSDSTITLALGQLTINHDMRIHGPDLLDGALIVSADGGSRVFEVNAGTVHISNVSFADGITDQSGGAIFISSGASLTLDTVKLVGNAATAAGGAIHNAGAVYLSACTLVDNTAGTFGGALYSAGAGGAALTNCTMSGNTALAGDGGGLFVQSGPAQLVHCTLTQNAALSAGGIRAVPDTSIIANSIITGNTADAAVLDAEGIFLSLGNNLIGNPTGSAESWDDADLLGIDADSVLDAHLRVNGGPLPTHALLADSPAIDAGDDAVAASSAIDYDQRGPGFDRVRGGAVDIGAYEVNHLVVNTLADAVPPDATDGLLSLREAVLLTYPGDIIEFSVTGVIALVARIDVDNGKPDAVSSLGLIGPGRELLTLSGGGVTQILYIPSEDSDVFIHGLAFAEGYDDPGNASRGGCALYNFGTVRITDCDLANNTASGLDGGAVHNRGAMSMTNCMLTGNQAENLGGAIVNWGGRLVLRACALSGNTAQNMGGGVANALGAALTMVDTEISGCNAVLGGGVHNASGAALRILRCTLAENTATSDGGAIFNLGALSAANGTLSGNAAHRSGGGLYHATGTAELVNCTLTGNTCDVGEPLGFGDGGGIFKSTGTLSLANTIVADNYDSFANAGTGNIYPDIAGTVVSQGNNLVAIIDGANGIANGTNNDRTGLRLAPLDAGLAALADNGGLTHTHLLRVASPAIDAGRNEVVVAPLFGEEPFTDQRGGVFDRVSDGNGDGEAVVDIGAVEFFSRTPFFASTPVLTVDEDALYQYFVETADLNLDEIYVITTEDLPLWLNLEITGNNTATLSGTPTNEDIGYPFDTRDFDITIHVEDWAHETFDQTFTITVNGVNDPPEPQDDTVSTAEDVPIDIAVLANDMDDDASLPPALVTVVTPPLHGDAVVNPFTGRITYTPSTHYNGSDSFEYQVTDDGTPLPMLSTVAAVSVSIAAVNDPPFTTIDMVTLDEDHSIQIPVLDNDVDVDGNLVLSTLAVATPALHGTTEVDNDTGIITYTPNENYNGTDSFQYRVFDDGSPEPALASVQTVQITINPVNDAPLAVDDAAQTNEDTAVIIPVLTNDSDVDGMPVPSSVVVATAPAHGQIAVNLSTGSITYTPNAHFNGTDSFEYAVEDNGSPLPALTAMATVNITVNAINDAPIAVNDDVTSDEDYLVTLDVLANDSDLDGNLVPASLTIVTQPYHGTARVNLNGTITYTPNVNYNGLDSFTYSVRDDGSPAPALTSAASVTILIRPINDPPATVNDSAATNEDTPVVVDVLANDSDVDRNLVPSTVALVVAPAHGVAAIDPATGKITYVPLPNYNGPDTLVYAVTDDGFPLPARTSTASVNFTINAVNDTPEPVDDTAVSEEDNPVPIDVLANDSDLDGSLVPASVSVAMAPAHGTTAVDPATGVITYTPALNFYGTDAFVYAVTDDGFPNPVLTSTATVVITVNPINDAPDPAADTAAVEEDTVVTVAVLANDGDVDGNLVPGSVVVTAPPAHGEATVNPATGAIAYHPNQNYNGPDSFAYSVTDDGFPLPALTSEATVSITITAVNDPPALLADDVITEEDTPAIMDVLTNDSDVDGNLVPGSVSVIKAPSNGLTSVNPETGVITYTPNLNFYGDDAFEYAVTDDGAPQPVLTSHSTAHVTVRPVNDPPVPLADVAQTKEDTAVLIPVLNNDTDVDADPDPATVKVVSGPAHGAASVNPATGVITYQPQTNYNGTDSFTYEVYDNGYPLPALSATASVFIGVGAVNDYINAVDDAATTEEDTPITVDVLANDIDIDGNPAPGSVTVIQAPAHGIVAVNPVTGEITYTPNPDFNGTDSVAYLTDDDGTPLPASFDTARLTIAVNPVNDAPILAAPPSVQGFQEIELPVDGIVLADVDVNETENAQLEATLAVAHGAIALGALDGVAIFSGAINAKAVGLRGTLSNLNAALATVAYTGDALYYGPDALQINVTDLGNTGAAGPLAAAATVDILLVPTSMVVTTLEDVVDGNFLAGNVSLREAVTEINSSGVITFAPGLAGALTLDPALGQLVIDRDLTILGPDDASITISGGLAARVFAISDGLLESSIDVRISNLTIADGNAGEAGSGGAMLNTERLTLKDCELLGSRAKDGGALHNSGALRLERCTGAGNRATDAGGFVISLALGTLTILDSTITANTARQGGGIMSLGEAMLTNTTVSGNLAADNGGGLYHGAQQHAMLTNCTFTGNAADNDATSSGNGGGLYCLSGAAPLDLRNTLAAGNMDMSGNGVLDGVMHPDVSGVFLGNQNNLLGSLEGSVGFSGSDIVLELLGITDIATVLDPTLDDNGGPVLTHALVFFSPAINAGNNAYLQAPPFNGPPFNDQRGPGYDRVIRDTIDIGAVEFAANAAALDIRIQRVEGQAALTGFLDIAFDLFFTENVRDFDVTDIVNQGSATGVAFRLARLSDTHYRLTVLSVETPGTIIPAILAGSISDSWGMFNASASAAANPVEYNPALDSDSDGIADVDEGRDDPDRDGLPNYLDEDADNDGINDGREREFGGDPYNPDAPDSSLVLSQSALQVGPGKGSARIFVEHLGHAVIPWTATLTQGEDWVDIRQGQTGRNGGIIWLVYQANEQLAPRQAIVRVDAPAATGFPVNITLDQEACPALAAPQNVYVMGLPRQWQVLVQWNPVPGAETYEVHCDVAGDTLLATVDTPFHVIETNLLGFSCTPRGFNPANVRYWVVAINRCGRSPASEYAVDRKHAPYAAVLPAATTAEGDQYARIDTPLAIRLRSGDPIDPRTVYGTVQSASGADERIEWRPAAEGVENDGWAFYQPQAPWNCGDLVIMTAGAETVLGAPVGPITYRFRIETEEARALRLTDLAIPLWQPRPGVDYEADAMDAADAAPAIVFAQQTEKDDNGGSICRLDPDQLFEAPRNIWIPLHGGLEADSVTLYYSIEYGGKAHWVPGEDVEGWLVPGSLRALELDGVVWLGVAAHHGGVLKAGPLPDVGAAARQGNVLPIAMPRGPGAWGDLLLLLAAIALLTGVARPAKGLMRRAMR